ncbi:MAG: hypothetical protein V1851_01890 [Patescibacteria group bacterium]
MPRFRSEKLAQEYKRKRNIKLFLSFVCLCLFFGFLVYISRRPEINIKEIEVIGNNVIKKEQILDIAYFYLNQKYLGILPKSNIFIYPKGEIKQEILNSYLKIQDLQIGFSSLTSIKIVVLERDPFALYCRDLDDIEDTVSDSIATSTNLATIKKQNEECYFMDKVGYIYANTESFFDTVYFKYFNENLEDKKDILGTTFLLDETGRFEKVNLFIRFLKDINIDVYRLEIKENGDYQLFFDKDSVLIFEGNQNFEILLENLQAVLIDLGDLGDKEFEYIDLRFENKVLYKFRE